jgi:hypothetical protein
MARGWESKAVADQIEEGKSERSRSDQSRLSPEELHKQEKLRSLILSKARLLEQLERATQSAHRTVLQNGLRAIEIEIEELSRPTR